MSRTSRCWQMALEPTESRAGRWSSSSTGTPHLASSNAAVCPTGPLPMTATRSMSVPLQAVPDLAVTLRGPDAWPVDAVQLVPQALHVEGQAVFEDRPAAVLGR